jgi:hypothetical protein
MEIGMYEEITMRTNFFFNGAMSVLPCFSLVFLEDECGGRAERRPHQPL